MENTICVTPTNHQLSLSFRYRRIPSKVWITLQINWLLLADHYDLYPSYPMSLHISLTMSTDMKKTPLTRAMPCLMHSKPNFMSCVSLSINWTFLSSKLFELSFWNVQFISDKAKHVEFIIYTAFYVYVFFLLKRFNFSFPLVGNNAW